MTAAVPEVAGPACDLCGQREAFASLMQLATYQQQRFCVVCAPEFLRAVADQVQGVVPDAADDGDQDQAAESGEFENCPLCAEIVAVADIPLHVERHVQAGELVVPVEGAGPAVHALGAGPDPTSAGGATGSANTSGAIPAGAAPPASTAPDDDGDPGPPGSAADHWASTTHVRRSTHGHRGAGKGKTGGPLPEPDADSGQVTP